MALMHVCNPYRTRRRLEKFLRERGVVFVRIEYAPQYGWPGHIVVFNSLEQSHAFEQSATCEALLAEVQRMHGNLRRHGQEFNARLAVGLRGICS